jgi:UDP-glucose 4-epimerase
MKILFTGGSSFTGYWFIKELASKGHDVVAVFRRNPDDYTDDPRRKRVDALSGICRQVFCTSFGDDKFLGLINEQGTDLLCCHGAEVTNYNKPEFDAINAVANNAHRLPNVLDALASAGCNKILLTGSVFENDEGAGSRDLRAFSPYGLSKGFTWQLFRYYAQIRSMTLGKFIIPNPFGPLEERRFTHYLMKSWSEDATPTVNTPGYVRDNIHVSLLAKTYVHFATTLRDGVSRMNPSGYVESQGAFTQRFASQMHQRLNWKCEFKLNVQTEYPEPRVRINTDSIESRPFNWSETTAWQELADYYAQLMGHR